MTTVSLQFSITSPVTLPKATVTTGPSGQPMIIYYPVQIPILGLLPGDVITSTHFVANNGNAISSGFSVGASSTDALTVQNTTGTADIVVASGYVIISRTVENYKAYNAITDSNGIVTISHGLYYQPTKYLATAAIGPNQEHLTLCFVSADAANALFQVFNGGFIYSNSPVSFNAQLS